MAPTNAPLGEQPGAEGNGAPPSSSDKSWIAALVDGLVPKFQADGSMQSGDSAMQTANKGKSSNAEAAQRASEPEDPSRLDPAFVVANARKSRTEAGEVEEGRKSGRRAKGIAPCQPAAGPAGSGTPATAPAGNVGSTSTSGPPADGHLDVQTGGSMNLDR
ncbi:hypothetical protein PtB15_17B10 [Puccinia triticina]|nr:hypothetical protein PtB15_17B10 [Puccinia triticina]